MPDEKQSYANHVRYDPSFHFLLLPVAAITVFIIIRRAVAAPSAMTIWMAFASLVFLYGVLLMRAYSMKVQDRVIRLEERLRLMQVLPESQRSRIPELTRRQLVALRFASDAELPTLVERCCNEKLESKQIKQAIKEWRADHFRV